MAFTGIVATACTYPGNIVPEMTGCMPLRMPNKKPAPGTSKKQVVGPFTIPRDPPGFFKRLTNRAEQHA